MNNSVFPIIKRGCSEYPLAYPAYKIVGESEEDRMQYPQKWKSIEDEFDNENFQNSNIIYPSLKNFCISDLLIIEKWIDYAKGLGDHTADLFADLPVKYDDTFELARARKLAEV